MARLLVLVGVVVVGVLVFFPHEVETAMLYARQMIDQIAAGAAGYYGAAAR